MSAETFYSNLKDRAKEIEELEQALLAEFYFIETGYYLNKSVNLILKMENNLASVVDESDPTKNRITKQRLNNAINLIACIYEELFLLEDLFTADETKNKLSPHCISLDKSSMISYYNSLRRFATDNRDLLGIDINRVFRITKKELAFFNFNRLDSKLHTKKNQIPY